MSYGSQRYGGISSGRRLHRPHSQGREARRPAGRAVDQVRAGHQRQDRQDARPHRAAVAARRRRRGDRVRRREFITLLGGAARRGRSRRARSSRRSCRPSGSWGRARLRPGANGPPLLCSGCANSVGSRVAPSRSSIAGRRDATSATPRSRPSSSGSRSMSLSRRDPQSSRQSRRHRSSRSSSRRRGTRSARPGRESGATGRQRHRPVDPADRSCRQATRTLARGCPRSPPVGDHGQCRQSRRRAGDGRGSGNGPHARPRSRHTRNPASGGYRARLRGAQGPRGGTLCL